MIVFYFIVIKVLEKINGIKIIIVSRCFKKKIKKNIFFIVLMGYFVLVVFVDNEKCNYCSYKFVLVVKV